MNYKEINYRSLTLYIPLDDNGIPKEYKEYDNKKADIILRYTFGYLTKDINGTQIKVQHSLESYSLEFVDSIDLYLNDYHIFGERFSRIEWFNHPLVLKRKMMDFI